MEKVTSILTVRELCSLLKIGRNTAYDLLRSGEIACLRIKGRYRIPEQAVYDYIQKNTTQLPTNK